MQPSPPYVRKKEIPISSTTFNALTKAGATVANYPFCTIEPNSGVVDVPDERMDKICEFIPPQRKIPATVEFVDIAGLVKGASKGEGLKV